MKECINFKGFTLVELLTILVIIGIVLVIAIPSVSKLTHNSDIKKLDNLISMTLEASDVYVDNYKKSFVENYDKYNFKYQTLLDNNLLKEEDIHCSGTIQATRKKGNNYTYNAYLMCKDKNGKEIYNNESELPDGGISIYGKFIMEYNVKLNDASGAKYNFDFTKENLYNEFVAYDLERPGVSAGISKFEYSFNGNDWTETIADSNSGVGSFTLTNTYNGKIYFRAYDLSGNVSETVNYIVKVDKEKPTGTITVARNGGSYNSLNVKATLSATDIGGSTLKQMCVQESSDITKCSWESYATSKTLTLSGTLNGVARTVYAWYKDKAGNISDIKSATYTPYTECSVVNLAACNKTCGGGVQIATDKYTGKACPSKNVTCNTQSCYKKPADLTIGQVIYYDLPVKSLTLPTGKPPYALFQQNFVANGERIKMLVLSNQNGVTKVIPEKFVAEIAIGNTYDSGIENIILNAAKVYLNTSYGTNAETIGYETGMTNSPPNYNSPDTCDSNCKNDSYIGNMSVAQKHASQLNALYNKGYRNFYGNVYSAYCIERPNKSCSTKYTYDVLTKYKNGKYRYKVADGAMSYYRYYYWQAGNTSSSIDIYQGYYSVNGGGYNHAYIWNDDDMARASVLAPLIPIITLRSDLQFKVGSGTLDNPYAIN